MAGVPVTVGRPVAFLAADGAGREAGRLEVTVRPSIEAWRRVPVLGAHRPVGIIR
jgi:hypothetical protein